jgi:hypothetical protein
MQKQKIVTVKQVKIMLKSMQDKEDKYWSLTIGLYPGILFGIRTYEEETYLTHVLYLPFIDIAFEIDK